MTNCDTFVHTVALCHKDAPQASPYEDLKFEKRNFSKPAIRTSPTGSIEPPYFTGALAFLTVSRPNK